MIQQMNIIPVQQNLSTPCSQAAKVSDEDVNFKSMLNIVSERMGSGISQKDLPNTEKSKEDKSTEAFANGQSLFEQQILPQPFVFNQADFTQILTQIPSACGTETEKMVGLSLTSELSGDQVDYALLSSLKAPNVIAALDVKEVAKAPNVIAALDVKEVAKAPNVIAALDGKEVAKAPNVIAALDVKEVAKAPNVIAALGGQEVAETLNNTMVPEAKAVSGISDVAMVMQAKNAQNVLLTPKSANEVHDGLMVSTSDVSSDALTASYSKGSLNDRLINSGKLPIQLLGEPTSYGNDLEKSTNEGLKPVINQNASTGKNVWETATGTPKSLDTLSDSALEVSSTTSKDVFSYATNELGLSDLYGETGILAKSSDQLPGIEKAVCGQLTDNILKNIKEGSKELQIDLYPAHLGKVSVKLLSENGVLTVEIMAANSKTQNMLLASADDIKSILQASVEQNIHVTEADQNQQLYQHQDREGQAGSYQQDEKQKNQKHFDDWFNESNDEMNTDDFLSMLEKVKMVSSQV